MFCFVFLLYHPRIFYLFIFMFIFADRKMQRKYQYCENAIQDILITGKEG